MLLLGLLPSAALSLQLVVGALLFGLGLCRSLLAGELMRSRGAGWLLAEAVALSTAGGFILLAPAGSLSMQWLQFALGLSFVLDGAWQLVMATTDERCGRSARLPPFARRSHP